ncbi:MAG: serine hydrolase [Pseudomonadota bacterium]
MLKQLALTCAVTALGLVSGCAEPTDVQRIENVLETYDADPNGDLQGVVVMLEGEVVAERYYNASDAKTLVDVRSSGKSVTSLLFGIARDQGAIGSLDATVSEYWRETEGAPIGAVKLRDLLTMRTGLDADGDDPSSAGYEDYLDASENPRAFVLTVPVKEPAGETYRYNSLAAYTAAHVIRTATSEPIDQFAEDYLFGPMGIKDWRWMQDQVGDAKGQGNLFLSTRAFAQLGQLIADEGRHEGQQIVSKDWLGESLSSIVDIGDVDPFATEYGYYWYRRQYPFGDKSLTVYFSSGNGGNKVMVVPEAGLVVAVTSTAYGQGRGHRRTEAIFAEVVEAIAGE